MQSLAVARSIVSSRRSADRAVTHARSAAAVTLRPSCSSDRRRSGILGAGDPSCRASASSVRFPRDPAGCHSSSCLVPRGAQRPCQLPAHPASILCRGGRRAHRGRRARHRPRRCCRMSSGRRAALRCRGPVPRVRQHPRPSFRQLRCAEHLVSRPCVPSTTPPRPLLQGPCRGSAPRVHPGVDEPRARAARRGIGSNTGT